MLIIHPLDALRHAVITAGGEIVLQKPFHTKCDCTIEKIIFRQNGNIDNPVVPGRLVFLGNNPEPDAGDNGKEILIQNMEELKMLRDIICAEPLTESFDKEFIVAEEYLNGETGDVDDSTILFSTFDEQEAQEYAEKHEIHDHRPTQVAIWEMEDGSCRDSWIIKKNFQEN